MSRAHNSGAWLHNAVRIGRGLRSAAEGWAIPLAPFSPAGIETLLDEDRLSKGLIIVLPGVEGQGPLNRNIAAGLRDGGIQAAIRIHDCTTRLWPLFLFHLWARRRNRAQARVIAQAMMNYQEQYPGRPISLVGHSGGGALAVWVLEELSPTCAVSAALLLGPALAPNYPLGRALYHTVRGIWNFCSAFDVLFLAAGTLLCGTMEGTRRCSAGFLGFTEPPGLSAADLALYRTHLHQCRYTPAMSRQFHLGGHFGWANRVFVAETLAPLLFEESSPAAA
jgi:hypothetical protein